jgi:hypothetical protein
MKQFTVIGVTKEIALRGTLSIAQHLKQGTYVFAADDRLLGAVEVVEAHVLSATGSRVLMIKGRNRDDDLDFVLSELGESVALTIYPPSNPENRVIMNVTSAASVVKLFGTMEGDASPDQDLDGQVLIEGSEAMTVHCYEPKAWRGNPTLQLDPKAAVVRLIDEAIQSGREVRINLAGSTGSPPSTPRG